MVHHAIPGSEPEFDPDSHDEQPEAALHSLIERLENEVSALHLNSFNQADALALGLLLVELATKRNLPVAIDIRRNEHVLFHVSLPGATPDNELWVQRKSRTTERYAEPSLLVGLKGRLGGGRLEDNGWFDEARYASHGGAFPIFVEGTGHVATATVSGLPQKADHDLVVEALTTWRQSITVDSGLA
ncbi:heme-degrading domain-containing protein [Arthrobacter gyeryongensis]|uniref:Heme-degrading domain-containing protein n=1 Tax=Arthrobacter gyeryongensis TaxID=1650592 RepID=A0ABP9SP56_9MICC